MGRVSKAYPWLTIGGGPDEAQFTVDASTAATIAEMDRRIIIMQELTAGRVVLAEDTVEASTVPLGVEIGDEVE
jgi:hypothetical protein